MKSTEPMGLLFDIKEFAVFDGFGIRTTVFLKGCPLACSWCHNPEGISPQKQLMVSRQGCLACGRCEEVCRNKDAGCILCGRCMEVCPLHLRRICGFEMSADVLAAKLLRSRDFFEKNEGGVTFSGGEPLAQPVFLSAVLDKLCDVHKAVETSGFCPAEVFAGIIPKLDLVIMDIKIADSELHKKYTGVDNALILSNLAYLTSCGKPFIIRVPLIPGVSDTSENLEQTAELLSRSDQLIRVELLPYHQTAGAKYEMIGQTYAPGFDTTVSPRGMTTIFEERGIPCIVL